MDLFELAGAGVFFFAKANIEQDSFTQAVTRIAQDTDAGWCDIANGKSSTQMTDQNTVSTQ